MTAPPTSPAPTRPREVVIKRGDETIACELAFKGMDDQLVGQWEVCTQIRYGDRLLIRGLGRNIVIAYPADDA